ncbi:hypothetical protein MATL_G00259340 [Megalops atlanticus]|uniref:Serine/threonine-protein kinase 1 n=1 Tax=Megalops atlanticus TaxID=7932 RepID=A0A9D3SZK0_MEGAT|nr:hypothetical protein MATL_G00259340 [Megalops atlanticus]
MNQSQHIRFASQVRDGRQQELPLEAALLQIVGSGDSRGVARLLDWFQLPEEVLLVLERPVPCMDLLDYLVHRGARLEESEAKVIMRQLVEAVQGIHSRGVVHRDLKPENVLIQSGSRVQVHLIDFGLGSMLCDSPYSSLRGTPLYLPPEWYLFNEIEAESSTVWQLGVILYQLLCRAMPFRNWEEIIQKKPAMGVKLSGECLNLLGGLLKKQPEARPTLEQILHHPWLQ